MSVTTQQTNALRALNVLSFAIYGEFLLFSDFRPFMDHGPLNFPLYRGLSLPTANLWVGGIIKQWGDGTHWSSDRSVAKSFADLRPDFIERYKEEHGTDGGYKEGVQLSRVIMRLDNAINVLPVGKILETYHADAEFLSLADKNESLCFSSLDDIINEKEYSIHDSDFEITAVDSFGEITIVDVKQIAISN